MTDRKDDEQNAARQLIAEANKVLARLQRERLRKLSTACLPAYDRLPRRRGRTSAIGGLTVDPTIAQVLAGSFRAADYADSDKAEAPDRAAESFARQLILYRKRLERDFDVFLCYNSEDKRQVSSINERLSTRGCTSSAARQRPLHWRSLRWTPHDTR